MKTLRPLLYSFSLLLVSHSMTAKNIKIVGMVKGIPADRVYLTDAYSSKILDSAKYDGSTFRFSFKYDKASFEPFLASIKYFKNGRRNVLIFLDNQFTNELGVDAFMVEPHNVIITGDLNKKGKLDITAGEQTEAMFSVQNCDFGFLGALKGKERDDRIKFYMDMIQKHPFSYFLLSGIVQFDHQYGKNEITKIVSLFSADLQKSGLANKLRSFVLNSPEPNERLKSIDLYTTDNKKEQINYNHNKINVYIFWASWCGPCRQEIPRLKSIFSQFKDLGINMASISIDNNLQNWHKALNEEKSPWSQFIIKYDDLTNIRDKFNFSAIPTVILVDNNGFEIKRYTGMNDSDYKNCIEVLQEHLQPK